MKSLHILHTEAASGWGGQEIRVFQEVTLLLERGYRVSVACRNGSPLEKHCRSFSDSRFNFKSIKMDRTFSLEAFIALYQYINKIGPDVIHTHSSIDSWLGGVAGKFSGIPVVRTRHVSLPVRSFFPNHLLYSYIPERILTSGEAISDMVKKIRYVDPRKVVSIPAGVDLCRFNPVISGKKIREEFKVKPGQPLVGKIGVIRGWKGHDYFLEAIPLILQQSPDTRFMIVGDGPGLEQIKSKVRMAGLEDRVAFLGYREDIPDIMAALDVQVLASFAGEGTPQVIPQAFAMKTPIVATKIASIPELLGNGERGVLIEPKNASSLAEGVLVLIKDPDLAVRLAENARLFCQNELTVAKMMDATLAMYEEIVSSPIK